jgi:hypothetical protein
MSITISGTGAITGVSTNYSFDKSVSIAGTVTYEDVTNVDSVGIITARAGIDIGVSGGGSNTFLDNIENGHLNIINSGRQANNGRVRINKTNDASGDTTYFRDFEVYDGKDNLVFLLDGSAGNIGINTDVPAHKLTVHTVSTTGYSTATGDTANTNTLLHLENQNGTDGAGVDNYVAAEFSVGRGATSQGWLGYTRTADNQGAFFIKQRNAASSYPETIRFPSSGGVTFGGGANTANTLDDYEEGSFTPIVSSTGNVNGSLATGTGAYTKIGRVVRITVKILNNSTSTSGHSGNVIIRGLPFVSGSSTLEQIATPITHNGVYGKFVMSLDFPGSTPYLTVHDTAEQSDYTSLFPNNANIRYYFSLSYTIGYG